MLRCPREMFIGHYAVGLASKKFAPRASLGVLIAAPILLDLLWPIFLLTGWEHVSIEPNRNPFLRFVFDSYPISHGLIALLLCRGAAHEGKEQRMCTPGEKDAWGLGSVAE